MEINIALMLHESLLLKSIVHFENFIIINILKKKDMKREIEELNLKESKLH